MASGRMRSDIQGLRALAVSLVVAYHLQENLVPGGFAGVDVFFAISGFLITSHLMTSPPERLGNLADFWGRRIRRLLPAALLVLAVTLVLVRLVAPQTQWANTAIDARGAALYILNWGLAARAVDYLGSEDLPTAVQHYWSLSVEEQFYLVWPLLIGAAVLLSRRLRLRRETTIGLAIATVVVVSLVQSIKETGSNPSAAYFVTTTRIWELGLGGLLAWAVHVIPAPPRRRWLPAVRTLGSAIGIGCIVYTAMAYSASTAFPGYAAALPVGGTLLVILCRPEGATRGLVGRALALRPIQRLGDISYSVYLWHWPLIVLAPWMLQHDTSWWAKADVLLVTITAAVLSEKYVERPFRTPAAAQRRKATFVFAAAGILAVAAGATYEIHNVNEMIQQDRIQLSAAVATGGNCFGAPALDPGKRCAHVPFKKLVPAPALASEDRSAGLGTSDGHPCSAYLPRFDLETCGFGVTSGAKATIALVGNSHAAHWLPALQVLARKHHWHIDTYLATRCALADVNQVFDTNAETAACRSWGTQVADQVIREHPDIVVMSNRISVPASGDALHDSNHGYQTGYTRILQRMKAAGLHVVVIHDTPTPHSPIPTCVAAKGADYNKCSGTPADWIPVEPAEGAVAALNDPHIILADLNAHICRPTRCYGVNGGVISFTDGSHMTATFNATLAPYLEPYLLGLLPHSPQEKK